MTCMICHFFFSVTYGIGIEMATGTSQSAAEEALRTTDEKANFQRFTRLLICGVLAILREVFDAIHPPPNLPSVLGNPAIKTKLQTLRRTRVLTHPEWECLYNPPSGAYGKSTDLTSPYYVNCFEQYATLPLLLDGTTYPTALIIAARQTWLELSFIVTQFMVTTTAWR